MKKKSFFLSAVATLILATATIAQTIPNYVPTNGLVGWWPFNGNANDESGNNNNGTVNGATLTSDRFGNANKAYSFDGVNDFINMNYSNSLDIINSISISCWIENDINNPSTYGALIFHGDDQGGRDPFAMGIYGNTNILQAGKYVNSGLTANDWRGGQILLINSTFWNNVVFTFETSNCNLKIFVNNQLKLDTIFTNACALNYQTNLNSFYTSFGGLGFVGQQFFNGKMDDIGIWNRALTQQEISDLYNGNICYQTITVTDTLIINTNLVGFNPITYQNTIKIYPNPTNDHITINYGNFATLSGYQLKIENSLGQQVFQTSINQQSSYLNLSTWGGNGIYFVRIIDPQGNTVDIRKIVLQ